MGRNATSIFQLSAILLAFVGGWFGYAYINQASTQADRGFLWVMGVILVTIAAIVIGTFLNIILHEAGHLAGGLLTGYGFVFFSVLGLSIIKENGKLVRKKYGVAGTGGGCMLSPPDMKNGRYPYKLYFSGGFLANFLASAICFSLFYNLAGTVDFWSRAFLVTGIASAFLGLTNFVPHNVISPSDGYFIFNLGKEKHTAMRRGVWSCFRTQGLIAEGSRPRDIPAELFSWVDVSDISDPFTMETAKNRYEYLLDRQELGEAKLLIQALCDHLQDAPEMQKMSCYCELLFHELIGECRQEEIDRLYDEKLKKYIKAAHSEISAQRLMYAYARLVLRDAAKAKEHIDLFHKACAMPLQLGFAPGGQELIALIDTIADQRESN